MTLQVFGGFNVALPQHAELDRAAAAIEGAGGEVRRFALLRPSRANGWDRWLDDLLDERYHAVIFFTAQTVRMIVELARQRGSEEQLLEALRSTLIVAAGDKPVTALGELGLQAEIRVGGDREAVAHALRNVDLRRRSVALASVTAMPELRERLEKLGARVRQPDGAASEPAESATSGSLLELIMSVDAVVFTQRAEIDAFLAETRAARRTDAVKRALARISIITGDAASAFELRRNGLHVAASAARAALRRADIAELAQVFGRSAEKQPAKRAGVRQTIVVVGNGMTSFRLCDRLTELDSERRYQLVVFSEEPRPAYDRVHLTSYFETRDADALSLADAGWYKSRGIRLLLGERAVRVLRDERAIVSSSGEWIRYDKIVFASGSAPFVPPIEGLDKRGVFVYRTIDDLEAIAAYAKTARTAVVLGGGLLGLEAAKAVLDLGLTTHVVETAPHLMPRQLDAVGAGLLQKSIEALGVSLHVGKNAVGIAGGAACERLRFADGTTLEADLVIISAGIRPRDELAREAGLEIGPRGGIVIDDDLKTSDPEIYAIGECALHSGIIYGLVGPCYEMAEALASSLAGESRQYGGSELSAKLKLLGIDVASFGDPRADEHGGRAIRYEDLVRRVYKKLIVSDDAKRLLGGVLVGDASDYQRLVAVMRSGEPLTVPPEQLLFGRAAGGGSSIELSDNAPVCSCNNVSKSRISTLLREGKCASVADVKCATRAGTGCGGCLPLVADLVAAELAAAGKAVKPRLCEHFAFSRQELYQIVKIKRIKTFGELLLEHGTGSGCEVCKPAAASIFASVHNELILAHDTLQDTNDRFLANIQRTGLYSIVPRVPAGEITPEKLITLGEIAKKFGLYTKITGGQRIDLLGARLEQLPDIWEDLVHAGFESGHAYGKAMRTVKSCVGTTWCRFGVGDSVGVAVRIEERYKGIRAPHKMKAAVSGCTRECAEAQSKDFGLIATEKGWNVYVCGNGGMRPRHADLLVSDVDADTAIRYLDRFIMYYIATADKLTRTSVWLEKMPGGIEYLRDVIIGDRLGICAELERDMDFLVQGYQCEWAQVVNDPVLRAKFRHYVNSFDSDQNVEFVTERGQKRPKDWPKNPANGDGNPSRRRVSLPVLSTSWVDVGKVSDFPRDGGMAVKYGNAQIAVFHFASRGEWYASQNMCPHMRDMVLARGLVGDQSGEPKVACPLHKRTFSLRNGQCLGSEGYRITTFPVRVDNERVFVELPPPPEIEAALAADGAAACQAVGASVDSVDADIQATP